MIAVENRAWDSVSGFESDQHADHPTSAIDQVQVLYNLVLCHFRILGRFSLLVPRRTRKPILDE